MSDAWKKVQKKFRTMKQFVQMGTEKNLVHDFINLEESSPSNEATEPGLPTACRVYPSGSERSSFQPNSSHSDTFAFKISKLPPYEHGVFIGKKASGNFKIVLTLDAILAEIPKAIKLARNNPVIVPDNPKIVKLLEEIDTAIADMLQISDDAMINMFPEPTKDCELFVTRMLRPFDRIMCSSTLLGF